VRSLEIETDENGLKAAWEGQGIRFDLRREGVDSIEREGRAVDFDGFPQKRKTCSNNNSKT